MIRNAGQASDQTIHESQNMIKNLTSFLDYSMFAELAVAMFAIIFVVIVIRTLSVRSDITKRQASIVLGDHTEEQQ